MKRKVDGKENQNMYSRIFGSLVTCIFDPTSHFVDFHPKHKPLVLSSKQNKKIES
jgi:hypothetical protein